MKTKNIFRMLLVAAALLMGANNVKAEEISIEENYPLSGEIKIDEKWFANVQEDWTLRIYLTITDEYNWLLEVLPNGHFLSKEGEFKNWKGSYYGEDQANQSRWNGYNDFSEGYIQLIIGKEGASHLVDGGLILKATKMNITNITLEAPDDGGTQTTDPVDVTTFEFESTWMDITNGQTSIDGLTLITDPTGLEGISYESGDEDVATVASDGKVSAVAPGVTTITARFAGNSDYNAATASYYLVVKHAFSGTTEGTSIWTGSTYFGNWHHTYGSYVTINSNDVPSAIKEKDKLRFYVAKETLGTDDNGAEWQLQTCNLDQNWSQISITNHWNTIDNSSISTNGYIEVEVNTDNLDNFQNGFYVQGHNVTLYAITLIPYQQVETKSISFGQANYTTTFGEAFTAPVPTVSPSGSSVIYTTNNKNVALVINNTVIPVGTGTVGASYGEATITATLADDESVSATYTLRVNAPTAEEGATGLGANWLGEYADPEKGFGGLHVNLSKADYFSSAEAGGKIRFYGKLGPLRTDSYWKLEIWDSPNWTEVKCSREGNGFDNGFIDIPVNDIKDFSSLGAIVLNGYNLTITAIKVLPPSAKEEMVLVFKRGNNVVTSESVDVDDDDYIAPTLYANGEEVTAELAESLGITFRSSNSQVASVESETGEVLINKKGTAVITATFPGNDTYNGATASYTLRVNENNSGSEEPGGEEPGGEEPGEQTSNFEKLRGDIIEYGYCTYVTTEPIDFSRSDGVEGYYASGVSGSNVVFTQVTGVCAANVPLLLKKKDDYDEDYCILQISTATGTTPANNLLHAGAQDETDSTKGKSYGGNGTRGIYVLTWHNDGPVFAETNFNAAIVDAEHAYLDLRGQSANSRLRISFKHGDDDTNGISNIETETINDGIIYNLRGQRVENPTKGLYIINGKKVVIK